MKRASISEAKNTLSALLDRVRRGQSVTIEDRGVPVARLEPIVATASDPAGRAERLERHGLMRPPTAGLPKELLTSRPPRPRDRRKGSDIVIDERRDGR
jgi:prevent-host-death family protein